jgi:adenylate cyclase
MPKRSADPLADPQLYAGVTTAAERKARAELLRYCHSRGASIEQLREAVREDRLATLPLEFALTSARRFTLTAVSRESGVPAPYLRAILLGLGHPNPRPRERAFSEEDLSAAKALAVFLKAGLPRDELLEVTRVIGQSLAQAATAIRLFIGNALIQPGDSEHDLALRYVAAVEQLTPQMTPVLEQQLRVHLREQTTREVIGRAEREAGALSNTREVGVCFADLSGFTKLGERVPAEQLGALGTRMATLCMEVAQPPVELVKTIGDGAMFVSADVDTLLDAACTLALRVDGEGEEFPTMRAGVASGPAVVRLGDWFGATVNRASRIADIAKPRTIVADAATRARSTRHSEWTRARRRGLKGIDGRIALYRLAVSGDKQHARPFRWGEREGGLV